MALAYSSGTGNESGASRALGPKPACGRAHVAKKPANRPACFHDLKRTATRNLAWAGVPERVVIEIGDWNTPTVFDRYNIVSESDLNDAIAKLERHLAKIERARDKDKTWSGKIDPPDSFE